MSLPWTVPGGPFLVGIDAISAVFLLPVFLVSLLGNVYGLGYWKQTEHPENGRKLRFFYGTLTAGMALVVIARNGVLFLFGWEIMALSAFFLVTTEDNLREVRRSGWIYLVATHAGNALPAALFQPAAGPPAVPSTWSRFKPTRCARRAPCTHGRPRPFSFWPWSASV